MILYIVNDCKCIYIQEDVNGLLKDKVDDGLLFLLTKRYSQLIRANVDAMLYEFSIHVTVSEIKQDINVSRPVMWHVWLEK